MTQSLIIQVGQCGNQMGCSFWDLAVKEYDMNQHMMGGTSDSFFRKVGPKDFAAGHLKARALLIDMEEGVIAQIMRGPLRSIFDKQQIVTDVSGSGNNWAIGYNVYGRMHRSRIEESVRKQVEICDSMQNFILLHSLSGGTGSGLGTAILEFLHENYPKKDRFVTSIYPTQWDDVVTSPYNAVLASNQLIEYGDCVLPIENKALGDIWNSATRQSTRAVHFKSYFTKSSITYENPFDALNNIVGNLLLNITSSSRFPGALNVDINELIMNMVPYPRMHFLTPSIVPLNHMSECASYLSIKDIFDDLFSGHHNLFASDLKGGAFLACALLLRGEINLSDVQKHVDRLRENLRFVSWNEDGWKTGLCKVKPVHLPYSAVLLSNNSSLWSSFISLRKRFLRMYTKKAHLHHFLQVDGFEKDLFDSALINLEDLIYSYRVLGDPQFQFDLPRMNVLV